MNNKVLTKRVGKISPESIDDYIKYDGYKALRKALSMSKEKVVKEVKESKLRGRGGAAFPTGIKMEAVYKEKNNVKYVVCNADEGEPGNFKDKYLMENDPQQLIEGIIIGAYAVGADKGYIYVRGEYNKSIKILKKAIESAGQKGFLGKNILGSGFNFEVEVCSGAGAYICGEEFALIESMEGKAGRPRCKTPFPTVSGLNKKPTFLSNVETFSNIPFIISEGAGAFASIGTESSKGTRLISVSGNVRKKGVYEAPFGTSVNDIIYKLGEGVAEGRKIKMVQIGGSSGPCIPESLLGIKIDYDEFDAEGISMGSGAVIVIDDTNDTMMILRQIAKFFNHESCGKCTPCREGTKQILNILNKFVSKKATKYDLSMLEELSQVMIKTSFCGLGQAAPTSIVTTMKYFKEDYISKIKN